MGLKAWLAANQQDERGRFYVARAGMHAFGVMSLACIVLSWAYMAQGRQDDALTVIGLVSLGQMVYWGLVLRWKATS
jgi:hypothetical protein